MEQWALQMVIDLGLLLAMLPNEGKFTALWENVSSYNLDNAIKEVV